MQTGTTMLLVSHDLEEAVYLADQVLLLTKRPTRVAEILPYARRASAHRRDAVRAELRRHQEEEPRDLPARSAALSASSGGPDRRMDGERIEAYVDAAAAALDLPLAPAHRPGVLAYFALAAAMADARDGASRSASSDEPAPVFVPIEPDDLPAAADSARRDEARRAASPAPPPRSPQAVRTRAVSALGDGRGEPGAHRRHRSGGQRLHRRHRRARARARRRARSRGSPPATARRDALPLLGVPFAVKNLFDVAGLTTRAGSKIERERPPAAADGPLIARLEARRRGAGRRAQHGRVRLRLHDRELARRADPQPARPGPRRRRLVGRLGRGGRRRPGAGQRSAPTPTARSACRRRCAACSA